MIPIQVFQINQKKDQVLQLNEMKDPILLLMHTAYKT